MIHYELLLIYSVGFKPSEVIRKFGYSRGSAYRFYNIYRDARKRAVSRLSNRDSVSPVERTKATNLGSLRSKRSVSSRGKEGPRFVDPACKYGSEYCIDPALRDKSACYGCINNPETDET